MGLFQWGEFTSHSGKELSFKLECDVLTQSDWECVASMVDELSLPFSEVYGVPRGGIKLAQELEQYKKPHVHRLLIVDDVLTTGASMTSAKQKFLDKYTDREICGAVLFSRAATPSWIRPVFFLAGRLYA